jgi:hypothetical protein
MQVYNLGEAAKTASDTNRYVSVSPSRVSECAPLFPETLVELCVRVCGAGGGGGGGVCVFVCGAGAGVCVCAVLVQSDVCGPTYLLHLPVISLSKVAKPRCPQPRRSSVRPRNT